MDGSIRLAIKERKVVSRAQPNRPFNTPSSYRQLFFGGSAS